MAGTGDVQFQQIGHLGIITLNRPRAINAISHEMVRAMDSALRRWAAEPSIWTVLLRGAGERGLCAGGDIVEIHTHLASGRNEEIAAFWRDEYRLDALIASYPKPYVAIMDGIVLGGGVGVSAHGSHRIVTERSRVGMPETRIGFIPDVGGTWLLSRTPGEIGTFMALTADPVDAGDAVALGLADAFVPMDRLGDLTQALTSHDADKAIAAVAQPAPPSELLGSREWIDDTFVGSSVAAIKDRLAVLGTAAASHALERIAANSPTALELTLAALRRTRGLGSLENALEQEYRVGMRLLDEPDFAEGIRARVIDRDRLPAWTELRAERGWVDTFFSPLATELEFAA